MPVHRPPIHHPPVRPSTVHPSTVPSSVAVPSPPSGPRASAQLCSPLGRPGTAPVSPDPVSPDPGAAPAGRFCSCCRQAQDTPASLWFQPCPPVPGLRDRHTQVHTPPSHTRTRIHVPHTCIHTTHVRAQTHTNTHTHLYGELRPRATLFLIHRPDQVPAGPRHPAQPGIQGQDPDPCASVGPFWVRVSVRTSLHLLQTFPQSPAVRFPCPGTSFFRSISFIFEEHFCYKKTVGFIPCAGPPFPRLRWGVQEFPPQGAVL